MLCMPKKKVKIQKYYSVSEVTESRLGWTRAQTWFVFLETWHPQVSDWVCIILFLPPKMNVNRNTSNRSRCTQSKVISMHWVQEKWSTLSWKDSCLRTYLSSNTNSQRGAEWRGADTWGSLRLSASLRGTSRSCPCGKVALSGFRTVVQQQALVTLGLVIRCFEGLKTQNTTAQQCLRRLEVGYVYCKGHSMDRWGSVFWTLTGVCKNIFKSALSLRNCQHYILLCVFCHMQ